jgi:DNA-binding CsgD family transcriptional regulator
MRRKNNYREENSKHEDLNGETNKSISEKLSISPNKISKIISNMKSRTERRI